MRQGGKKYETTEPRNQSPGNSSFLYSHSLQKKLFLLQNRTDDSQPSGALHIHNKTCKHSCIRIALHTRCPPGLWAIGKNIYIFLLSYYHAKYQYHHFHIIFPSRFTYTIKKKKSSSVRSKIHPLRFSLFSPWATLRSYYYYFFTRGEVLVSLHCCYTYIHASLPYIFLTFFKFIITNNIWCVLSTYLYLQIYLRSLCAYVRPYISTSEKGRI